MLVQSMSRGEKSEEAALRVCCALNKHQKPFTDSEILKECVLEVATALFKVFLYQQEVVQEEQTFWLMTTKII